jgi:hypothetical protein
MYLLKKWGERKITTTVFIDTSITEFNQKGALSVDEQDQMGLKIT